MLRNLTSPVKLTIGNLKIFSSAIFDFPNHHPLPHKKKLQYVSGWFLCSFQTDLEGSPNTCIRSMVRNPSSGANVTFRYHYFDYARVDAAVLFKILINFTQNLFQFSSGSIGVLLLVIARKVGVWKTLNTSFFPHLLTNLFDPLHRIVFTLGITDLF